MSVLTEASRATFAWTGVETAFSCGFPADKTPDLQVFFVDDDGVQSQLTQGVHFTASLANTTKLATVLPAAMPPAPGTLIVQRRTPTLVPETLADGQEFSLRVIQQMFDRQAMAAGEFRTLLARAITLREGGEVGVDNYDLEGSGLSNLKPGTAPTDAATVSQVQAMQVADGNVPSPVLGDVNKLLIATGTDSFGWVALALAHIADGLFTADAAGRAKFAAAFVTTALLADGVFSADAAGRAKLADGFFGLNAASLAKFADGFLAASAAGRAKMADKFLTLAKLDDVETAVLLGRKTAGTGPVEKLTAADTRTLLGADSVLLQTIVLAGSQPTIDFTTLTGYSRYIIEFEDLAPATDDTPLLVRMNDGSSWLSSGGSYAFGGSTDGPAASANMGSSTDGVTTSICLSRPGSPNGIGNAAGETCSGEIVFDVGSSTTKAKLRSRATYYRADGLLLGANVTGGRTAAGLIAGIRLQFGAGNFQNIGRVRLRGVL